LLITSFTLEQISIWFTHILFYCEYPCHHYNQLAKFFVAVIHIIECAIANCEKKFTPYLPRISMNVGWKVPMMLLQNIEKKIAPDQWCFLPCSWYCWKAHNE
jgi:hypothetical protein